MMRAGGRGWFQRLNRFERQWILARIDAGGESARDIFDDLDLSRYCRAATFRGFVTRRKHEVAMRDRAAERLGIDEPFELEELEKALFLHLRRLLVRGTARPSLLTEVRLLLKELDRRKQARSGGVGRGKSEG
ncbi:MAG TPA: hypothetical protein VM487_03290 [Phycisphaerae bacterium]|nr:hypothetical protein [Phycisphaerae bacterium]